MRALKKDPASLAILKNKIAGKLDRHKVNKTKRKEFKGRSTVGDDMFEAFGW